MAMRIEVVEYNPDWEKKFKTEAKKIKEILGRTCIEIHHIGSTAVKGLKAQPIIDIMLVVTDISAVDAHNAEFETLGYACMGEDGIPGSRFYTKGGDNYTHHLSVFKVDNKKEIARRLAVRDYLNSHQDVVKEYAKLKTGLAGNFAYDHEGYCDGKDAFMKDLEQKALEWKKQEDQLGICMSIGMSIGVGIGSAVGVLHSNIVMGLCAGLTIGLCMGLCAGLIRNKKSRKKE